MGTSRASTVGAGARIEDAGRLRSLVFAGQGEAGHLCLDLRGALTQQPEQLAPVCFVALTMQRLCASLAPSPVLGFLGCSPQRCDGVKKRS